MMIVETTPASSPIAPILDALNKLPRHENNLSYFARQLYGGVEEAELKAYNATDLAAIASAAYGFFEARMPGEPKMRIYEPQLHSGAEISVIELINDDMPFLLDSVLAEIRDRSLSLHFVAHPIFRIERDPAGRLNKIISSAANGESARSESFIHLHVRRIASSAEREALLARLAAILSQVRSVTADHPAMLARLDALIESYNETQPPVPVDTLSESVKFLEWLADGNFIFLGARAYDLGAGMGELVPIADSGLGLLRDVNLTVLRRRGSTLKLTPASRELFLSSTPLVFAMANAQSEVYRRGHMYSIGVKIYSPEGNLRGEMRFVGLFTTGALTGTTRDIPLIRLKAGEVFRRSGFAPDSHSGRVLSYVLETFPREEWLQMKPEQLFRVATAITQLQINPRTRVFVREDDFGRYVSIFVYVMRDRYTTAVRERICALFARLYGGKLSSFTPFFTEGPLVRLNILIWREEEGDLPQHNQEFLEAEVDKIVRTWRDELKDRLIQYYGDAAQPKIEKYLEAFPAGYEEANRPSRCLEDIQRLEVLTPENPTAIDIFSDTQGPVTRLRAMLHQLDEPITLSRRVPILENLGFHVISERTYELTPMMAGERRKIFIHDSIIETSSGAAILTSEHEKRLEEGFVAIWQGKAENDRFNGLILNAQINWHEAALMRAYAAYLRQAGAPFGLIYLAQTLNRHGSIVRDLVRLFDTLFNPGRGDSAEDRQALGAEIAKQIEAKLQKVPVLDEDRVLRRFLNLIQATLRTNFYQPSETGGLSDTIALKLRSAQVEGLPEPKPYAEIFVTSPRFEGVHLRGGPIARGGLRWSDRAQDFRTEVLGLAKAQNVKNVVIVPQGAKGGFVPRMLPNGGREAMMAEGVACYKAFVKNLLSITDNLVDGKPVPPPRVVRHDGDDPYLVVAADKGTATFSDIANSIAIERGFWLGDAFASGGSAGYDHKKMGITARGAWEAVKRHFREMNIDIQTQPFRVIGVGDMSGDVFGNGMLLSKAIKLIAAFDHRDIFIDPDPDPGSSWEERKRLFDLPRSSWQDYDRTRLSKGGGIFSRTAKSIDLSPEARALFNLPAQVTPNELMTAILKADADLIWFGGIGTFVRASNETNEEVNDRTNDAIRITAAELRAKVAGEGANLGMTQKARIEFAMRGGRVNTDAIDNSAGVNSSDYEVNIKIALGAAMAKQKLSLDERNAFLASMTEAVAERVLRNNYLQTLAISLGEQRGAADLGFQRRLMSKFEASGLLDRKLESLPSDTELRERQKTRQPLTRPELAVLLAYAKIDLKREILASSVPDDPYLGKALAAYFPEAMRQRFAEEIASHPLRNQIIATVLTNDIINRGGSTFAVRLTEETGHGAEAIAYAFAASLGVFGLSQLYGDIDALDGKIDGQRQLALYLSLQDILRQTSIWFLRHGRFGGGLTEEIVRYRESIERIAAALPAMLSEAQRQALEADGEALVSIGVSRDLAARLAQLPVLAGSLDIALTARETGHKEAELGAVFFETAQYFRLDDLRLQADSLARGDYFERLAVNGALEAIGGMQRGIMRAAIALASRDDPPSFAAWREANQAAAARTKRNVDELLDAGGLSLAMLTVAVSHLRDLA